MHHIGHLARSVCLLLIAVVVVVYMIIHPVNAVTMAWRVVTVFVEFADNLATGRYQ